MKKLYILCCLLLLIGAQLSAQERATPVLNKSNRIILHYKDTTGLFTALARILIDRGHDIEYKDRELGLLRTKPSLIPGGYLYAEQMEVKTVFRDSTITLSGVGHSINYDRIPYKYEVAFYKKRWYDLNIPWDELVLIAGLMKADSVTYLRVEILAPRQNSGYVKPPK